VTLKRECTELLEADEAGIAPPAVLRRSEGTRSSSPSDDEVGGLQRRDPRRASLASEAIKAARSAPSERTMRRRYVKLGSRAAVLDERASRHAFRRRESEEGSGLQARSAPSERSERGNQI
jgi:hypothetical protein